MSMHRGCCCDGDGCCSSFMDVSFSFNTFDGVWAFETWEPQRELCRNDRTAYLELGTGRTDVDATVRLTCRNQGALWDTPVLQTGTVTNGKLSPSGNVCRSWDHFSCIPNPASEFTIAPKFCCSDLSGTYWNEDRIEYTITSFNVAGCSVAHRQLNPTEIAELLNCGIRTTASTTYQLITMAWTIGVNVLSVQETHECDGTVTSSSSALPARTISGGFQSLRVSDQENRCLLGEEIASWTSLAPTCRVLPYDSSTVSTTMAGDKVCGIFDTCSQFCEDNPGGTIPNSDKQTDSYNGSSDRLEALNASFIP
ncbi:hypothetical protein OAF82_00910 [bacterium]|nr:hypothetical protein [bacterium]